MTSVSRRSFLKAAGVAAGGAAISAAPVSAAGIADPDAVEMTPTTPIPREPVIAIVRDADLGEVTLLIGTTEKTYKDRQLVNRLLKAARQIVRAAGEGRVA